jgi:hypothetical protein
MCTVFDNLCSALGISAAAAQLKILPSDADCLKAKSYMRIGFAIKVDAAGMRCWQLRLRAADTC